jgi:hypothetical protein
MRVIAICLMLLVSPAFGAELTERTIIDKIEILGDGRLQVREATVIDRDGVEVSRRNHRYVLDPAVDQVDAITDPRLRSIAELLWTEEVVTTRQAERQKTLVPPPER